MPEKPLGKKAIVTVNLGAEMAARVVLLVAKFTQQTGENWSVSEVVRMAVQRLWDSFPEKDRAEMEGLLRRRIREEKKKAKAQEGTTDASEA